MVNYRQLVEQIFIFFVCVLLLYLIYDLFFWCFPPHVFCSDGRHQYRQNVLQHCLLLEYWHFVVHEIDEGGGLRIEVNVEFVRTEEEG